MAAYHHFKPLNHAGEEHLHLVVTVQEAARLVHRHENTIRYAINAGNVAARKADRVWLIAVPSLVAYYGPLPHHSLLSA